MHWIIPAIMLEFYNIGHAWLVIFVNKPIHNKTNTFVITFYTTTFYQNIHLADIPVFHFSMPLVRLIWHINCEILFVPIKLTDTPLLESTMYPYHVSSTETESWACTWYSPCSNLCLWKRLYFNFLGGGGGSTRVGWMVGLYRHVLPVCISTIKYKWAWKVCESVLSPNMFHLESSIPGVCDDRKSTRVRAIGQ